MATHTLWRTMRLFNYTRGISCNLNLLCVNNQRLQYRIVPQWINVNSEKSFSDIAGIDDQTPAKKKKLFVQRVSLLSEKDEMSIVTLEEAQKIAKRRNFKLVKVVDFDTKSKRPIYKLMKMHEFTEAEMNAKAEAKEAKSKLIKDEKTMTLSSKITEHDLNIKIKSIHKMLGKKHGVRVVISIDGNKDKAMEIADLISERSKDVAAVNKGIGGFSIKVIMRPILEQIKQDSVDNQESSNGETK